MIHLENAKGLLRSKALNKEDKEIVKLITIEGNVLTIPIQDGTIPEVGVNGIQVTDLLKYTKEIFVSLNASYPCKENQQTISHIEAGIAAQVRRTADREKRRVEGTHTN